MTTQPQQNVPSDDEAPTERFRRPEQFRRTGIAPMPGSLNLAGTGPAPGEAAPDRTEILSIDELMDGPGDNPASSPVTPPAAAPRATPAPGVPAQAGTRELRDRLRTDASAALSGAVRRTEGWLRSGDNAVIVATMIIAVFLLVAVAAL